MAFWISTLLCLIAGAAGGWALRRVLDPVEQRLRQAEREREEAQLALRDYKTQVTEHFRGTAERVNRLTDDYRELHQHLSDGALVLCDTTDASGQPPLLTSLSDPRYASEQAALRGAVAPPVDYAMRRSPSVAGAATDDFDIDRVVDD